MNNLQQLDRYPYYLRSIVGSGCRRVTYAEHDKLYEHYRRLDDDDRRMRFCGEVSDSSILKYSARPRSSNDIVLGLYVDDCLRGVCEMIADNDKPWATHAEVAVSVESPWQNQGIGKQLFHKITVMAKNRGIKALSVDYENYNRKMNSLVASYNAKVLSQDGAKHARITLAPPSFLSWYEEMAPISYQRINRLRGSLWHGRVA